MGGGKLEAVASAQDHSSLDLPPVKIDGIATRYDLQSLGGSLDLNGSKTRPHMILAGGCAAELLPIVLPVYLYEPAHLE